MIIKTAVLTGLLVLLSASMDSMHGNSGKQFNTAKYQSEGERLYFTGVSSTGEPMIPIGGHHHMQMHGGSCVTCHGADKQGGTRMWPRFWVVAPALTTEALVSEHNDDHNHATYDEGTLKRAILEGQNPDGKSLHESMPRWKMSESSLNALVEYLLVSRKHTH